VNQINANPNSLPAFQGISGDYSEQRHTITFTPTRLRMPHEHTERGLCFVQFVHRRMFSTSVAVNDALGASHVLTYTFTKTGANAWNYSITIPAADVGAIGNPVVLKTGTMAFNGSGQ